MSKELRALLAARFHKLAHFSTPYTLILILAFVLILVGHVQGLIVRCRWRR